MADWRFVDGEGNGEGLTARSREVAHINDLLRQVRSGKAGALALHGESGVGKSALVDTVVARASELHVVQIRAPVVPSPAPWPHPFGLLPGELALPAVGRGNELVRDGMEHHNPGPPPDRAVGAVAAAVSQLGGATGRPVVITVDDAHLLPQWFVDALAAAVVGPLQDEPVGLVLAWRETPHVVPFQLGVRGIPHHRLGGLNRGQAATLLAVHFTQVPDDVVLTALLGASGGNPLALVEAYGRLRPEQIEGWEPLPDPLPIGAALAEAFDVGGHLPNPTRRAMAAAAASRAPRDVLFGVIEALGGSPDDLAPAVDAGIVVERGPRVDFEHPLVRAAAYQRASQEARRSIRRALSEELARRDAVEPSAYFAVLAGDEPDRTVTRRLAQAVGVALERGDPAAAARYEEMASRYAVGDDAAGEHRASAAALWEEVGERERADQCLAPALLLSLSDSARSEVLYLRARIHPEAEDVDVAERMVEAADLAVGERPNRALAMLLDAAAWKVLADDFTEAEAVAERAVRLSGAVSSSAEALSGAVLAAASHAAGHQSAVATAEHSRVSLLIGQTDRFPASPEVALVIGESLARLAVRQAERWAQWLERCAADSGQQALAAVSLLVRGRLALRTCGVADAVAAAQEASRLAERYNSEAVQAVARCLATVVYELVADYEAGFREGAKAFMTGGAIGRAARARTIPALAMLDLQRGLLGPAVAWARTAEEDLGLRHVGGLRTDLTTAELGPMVASVVLLARRPTEEDRWAVVAGEGTYPGTPGWREWLRGVTNQDADVAIGELAAAAAAAADHPLTQARIELCRAVRLAAAGRVGEARAVLEGVVHAAGAAGALGVVRLAERELDRLPAPAPVAEPRGRSVLDGSGPASWAPPDAWEVALLGGFGVRHQGSEVYLPASLATQAIKIVALQSRITVDELVEHLWEEAEPGVGTRRLRNVLWRIRSTCGELLVRDGEFVRLAPGAVTDLARFRHLGEQAVAEEPGSAEAAKRAREALAHYRGELLPGDRYADWTTATREAVSRLHLRLLDLLVDDALVRDRRSEALSLLDRLTEADPYDERHYLRIAEIHLDAGNRGRALDALERAERMLDDLALSPSPAVRRLRSSLDQA
ncbi:MAG TPA: BTAD domain-containing putative transcriptional regulator [Acidimicrobiales bacterium]|nr:BTAD domain-containing putative transcriptional regulator [Acidimicrobiales bacterium]